MMEYIIPRADGTFSIERDGKPLRERMISLEEFRQQLAEVPKKKRPFSTMQELRRIA